MATPAYSGGGFRRGRGGRHWGHTPAPTDTGWLDSVGSWFDGNTPQYAGAGQPIESGVPVYRTPPPPTATPDADTTAPQMAPSVIVVPHT